MRVSSAFSQQIFLRNLEQADARLAAALSRMSTGKRVLVGSDDPVAASELVQLADEAERLTHSRRRNSQSLLPLRSAEEALFTLGDQLLAAQTKGQAASSDPPGDIPALRIEVQRIRETVEQLANTQVSDRYIFSGTKTDTPPYDAAGVYQGSSNVVEFPLEDGDVQVTFNATEFFGEKGVGGALDALDQLETALDTGDQSSIRAALADFDGLIETNSVNLARVGAEINKIEDANERIDERKLVVAERASNLGDADLVSSITEVLQLSSQYETTLSAGARLFGGGTLFDFIG